MRYLPQSLISDVPRVVAGLREWANRSSAIFVPEPPVIRKGASGTFARQGAGGGAHHAVVRPPSSPSTNCGRSHFRSSSDEKKLFDVIAQRLSGRPDARLLLLADNRNARRAWLRIPRLRPSTHRSRLARSFPGLATCRRKGRRGALLPPLRDGETAQLQDPKNRGQGDPATAAFTTKALRLRRCGVAWRFADDEVLRERLAEATRALARRRPERRSSAG